MSKRQRLDEKNSKLRSNLPHTCVKDWARSVAVGNEARERGIPKSLTRRERSDRRGTPF